MLSANIGLNSKTTIRDGMEGNIYPAISLDNFTVMIMVVDPDKADELAAHLTSAANKRRQLLKDREEQRVEGVKTRMQAREAAEARAKANG